jgi:hypothetical protein
MSVGGAQPLVSVALRTSQNLVCTLSQAPAFVDRGGEPLGQRVAAALTRMIAHPGAFDRTSLGIIPGTVWILKVSTILENI